VSSGGCGRMGMVKTRAKAFRRPNESTCRDSVATAFVFPPGG
jgi:hypothetical protein